MSPKPLRPCSRMAAVSTDGTNLGQTWDLGPSLHSHCHAANSVWFVMGGAEWGAGRGWDESLSWHCRSLWRRRRLSLFRTSCTPSWPARRAARGSFVTCSSDLCSTLLTRFHRSLSTQPCPPLFLIWHTAHCEPEIINNWDTFRYIRYFEKPRVLGREWAVVF